MARRRYRRTVMSVIRSSEGFEFVLTRSRACSDVFIAVSLGIDVRSPRMLFSAVEMRCDGSTIVIRLSPPVLVFAALSEKHGLLASRRRKWQAAQAGGTGLGFPWSSMATKVKVASVTFSRTCVWNRRAQASIWIFMDVRPTLSTAV